MKGCNMDDYIVRYKDMPVTIPAFFKEDSNGDYNIYVNSRLSTPEQIKALNHEKYHIEHDDLTSDLPLAYLESRAG